jgi:hypothetical protein
MTVNNKTKWREAMMALTAIEAHHKKPCPVCGGVGECRLTRGTMATADLTQDQWKQLYEFIVTVQLPFIHKLLSENKKPGRPIKYDESS